MKTKITALLLTFGLSWSFAQSKSTDFTVTDLATQQITKLQQLKSQTPQKREKAFTEQLYTPHESLWKGYLGDAKSFASWMNETGYAKLNEWKKKDLNPELLTRELYKHAQKMQEFTGYQPVGKWYLIFGPAWTNLGGLSTSEMLIDLASAINTSNERIIKLYPHELNHQIYKNTVPESPRLVLNRVLDEGFATYVSYLYHKKKYTPAEELGYSEDQYQYCIDNELKIKDILRRYYRDENEETSRKLADRSHYIGENFPGAIGYFIGFRIVENYVKIHGENSWKDIYKMTPLEVLEKSQYLK